MGSPGLGIFHSLEHTGAERKRTRISLLLYQRRAVLKVQIFIMIITIIFLCVREEFSDMSCLYFFKLKIVPSLKRCFPRLYFILSCVHRGGAGSHQAGCLHRESGEGLQSWEQASRRWTVLEVL